VKIVREPGCRPDKNIIFHHDSVPEENAALDGYVVADNGSSFQKGVIANVAVFADSRTGREMGKSPHATAFANLRAWFHQSLRVAEVSWLNGHPGFM
jgi:hypothetical protein